MESVETLAVKEGQPGRDISGDCDDYNFAPTTTGPTRVVSIRITTIPVMTIMPVLTETLAMEEAASRAGTTIERIVELCHILPTILDGTGLPLPDGIFGKSLLCLIEDESRCPWRSFVDL
jgi:hypothetical protein